jgi:subtilisin family serine protease
VPFFFFKKFAAGSYDFNDHTDLPKPRLSDDTHGTRCAGEIAAVKNGVCGVGMAYDAKVAGKGQTTTPKHGDSHLFLSLFLSYRHSHSIRGYHR